MKVLLIKRIILYILFVSIYSLPMFSEELTVSSPNGKMLMKIYEKGGNIYYTAHYNGKPIILESLLGINGAGNWKDGVSNKSVIEANLLPSGGQAIWIESM